MEAYKKCKLNWFSIFCMFCIPVLTSHAGILPIKTRSEHLRINIHKRQFF
jgi:hypothetical protein